MSFTEVAFALSSDVHPRAVMERAAGAEPTRALPEAAIRRVYLDTFDWRLFRAGLVLVDERAGGRNTLRLASRDGTPTRSVRARRPSFAPELPEGWLRARLAPILGVRRLLARVGVEGTSSGLALLDDEEKTLARLYAEVSTAVLPDGTRTALPAILRVERLRGYATPADELVERIAEQPEPRLLAGSALEQALRSLGEWPGSDPSKPTVALHATTRADRALSAVLLAEVSVVQANEAGVSADLDVEFLHDLRVACRRSRALLAEMGDVLEPDAVAAAREGLAWIGARTGPLRDLDVFLSNRGEWMEGEALKPMIRTAKRLRARALRDVRKMLSSKRYRAVLDAWNGYLADETTPPRRDVPIAELARERIRLRAARVRARGRKLTARSPAEKIHRLRLQAKKLRYLLDAFGPALEIAGAGSVRRSMGRLQDALGAYNDAGVEDELISAIAAEMERRGEADAGALLAMGRRQAELERRRRKARRKLARRVAKLGDDPELARLCTTGDGDGA
jgi:CHAD domain-containing protein